MRRLASNVWPDQLLADAGYDSEANHQLLREQCGIESIIPPKRGRPSKRANHLPAGKSRWLMATAFNDEAYGQRWQSETGFFMIKRHQGQSLKARTRWTRHREMGLMALTHNIMILPT